MQQNPTFSNKESNLRLLKHECVVCNYGDLQPKNQRRKESEAIGRQKYPDCSRVWKGEGEGRKSDLHIWLSRKRAEGRGKGNRPVMT